MASPYQNSTSDTSSNVQDAARQVYAKAEDAAKVISREATKAYRNPDRYFHNLQDEASSYIRANPTHSMLIAVGLGFALGALHKMR